MSRHNRERRQREGGPPGAGPSLRQEMQRVVLESRGILARRWGRRNRDDDILILGDLRRPEAREMAVVQLGRPEGDRVLRESEAADTRPMVACLQPAGFVDILARDGDFAHR